MMKKSLNEVIEIIEMCGNIACVNCKYRTVAGKYCELGDQEGILDLALDYLKELKRYVEGKRGETELFGTPLNENVSVRPEGVYCNVCGTRLDLERDDDDEDE